jgi:2'-5' RNA ligase
MRTIRSFIAVPLPVEVQRRVGRVIDLLASDDDGVKWVPAENLHLTLKFLGDVDNRSVPEVCQTMRACCREQAPFGIELSGMGAFPDVGRTRVLWIGVVQGEKPLTELVERLEEKCAAIGFKREPRRYQAHLTIGRMKTGRRPSDELREKLTSYEKTPFGSVLVNEIHLVASFLEKRGASYTVMDRAELA